MFLPKPEDAIHKAWLYRLLTEIADDAYLADVLRFKGGTCAAMLGYLDRFSVDLDFDISGQVKKGEFKKIDHYLQAIFKRLDLTIKSKSQTIPQYFLRYPADERKRNTIKIDMSYPPPKSNEYEPRQLIDIDRVFYCQTIETMFANKLVALLERYEKYNLIAGRDLYDVHHYFLAGHRYLDAVILERRGSDLATFFKELRDFVAKKITQRVLDQDLNTLLGPKKFRALRKTLKQETLMFLK